jgi:translation initiation factor 1A
MPKNKGKGGKNRRRGKNENDVMKRELIEKDGNNQGKTTTKNSFKFSFKHMRK